MEKLDHRSRVTRMLIRRAFTDLLGQKPIESISVKELCAAAGINRGTFYGHYQDLYDLRRQMEEEMMADFQKAMEPLLAHVDGPGGGAGAPVAGPAPEKAAPVHQIFPLYPSQQRQILPRQGYRRAGLPAPGSGTNPPGHRRLGPPQQRRPCQGKRSLRSSQKARNVRAFFFCAGKDTIPVKGNKTLLRGAPCKGRPRQTCCPQTAFVPRCSHGVSPFGKKRLTTGEKIVIILTLIN